MPIVGEYEPSPSEWVRNQVEEYESSGGQKSNTLLDTGLPVVIVTTRGNRSHKVRKTPLMRVEHEGHYALVASMGGAPTHPVWYHNLKSDPTSVTIQDGPDPVDMEVREVEGEERETWWQRAVAAYPPYAEYQQKTERVIPVFVASPLRADQADWRPPARSTQQPHPTRRRAGSPPPGDGRHVGDTVMMASTGPAGLAFPLAAVVALGASFLLVSRLERLSNRLHLSEAMLGLVVALAADSPEITSAISASAHGQTTISSGVVLGSNVFNLAALLGLGAIVARRIALHRRVILLEGAVGMWVAVVTLLMLVAKWRAGVGLALVLVVVVPYVLVSALSPGRLLRLGLAQNQVDWLRDVIEEEEEELALGIHPVSRGRLDATVALASLVVVVVASIVMERSAETLGRRFGLSSLVVGGVILAAVTSLPNAVGAVYLAVRGRGAATLSEAMNSNMLNVLIGLLLPGIFLGLGATGGAGLLVGAWYVGLTVLCLLMAYVSRGLTRQEGVLIVAGYAAFVVAAVAFR